MKGSFHKYLNQISRTKRDHRGPIIIKSDQQ